MSSDALRALDSDPAIFPGALVQGGSLLDGQLQQIRGIPRAGGTVYLTNLILDGSSDPSDSKDPLYTRQVTQVSGATINEALQQILSNETLGTAARATYSENVGYSSEQIKFDMGLDADFPSGSFEGSLSVGTDTQKSYTYLMFTQIYYDLIFDSWTGPVSLFAAGENFSDPNDELGPGNPPLFVEKVSYGRQVLYIMESDYAATDVQAAMEAAYNGATADVNFRADLTYRKVMANTRVSYVVRGGDASVALQAIDSATNAERFEKVKASLADKKSANYSSSSPGVPVFYTLRYLDNNGLATMDRAVTYNKRNCIYEAGPGPLDGTEIFVDGQHDKIQIRQTWTGDVDRMRFSLAVAPAITWWKALEIGSRKEFLETENSNRGPIQSLKYTHGDFDPNAPTIPVHFWKAKGFGVHTYLQEKRFNVEDLLGYETHFYWVND
jgi:hypothetical protein